MEAKKVVITGGLGHVGSHLVRTLGMIHSDLLQITILDDLSTQRYCSLIGLPQNTKFVESDYSKCASIIDDADVIIHLAAHNEALKSLSNVEEYYQNNVHRLKKLVNQVVTDSQIFIFPSTTSIYGSNENDIAPQSVYAQTKIEGERIVSTLPNHYILRLGTIFGPSRGMRFHTAINKFCLQAYLGQKLTIWKEYLDFTRAYLGLRDLSDTILEILKGTIPVGTYNLVSENKKLSDIINYIREIKLDVKVDLIDSPLKDQKSYEVSCDHIKKYVKISETLRNGIFRTMDYLEDNR